MNLFPEPTGTSRTLQTSTGPEVAGALSAEGFVIEETSGAQAASNATEERPTADAITVLLVVVIDTFLLVFEVNKGS
jgi:hypothetical protein